MTYGTMALWQMPQDSFFLDMTTSTRVNSPTILRTMEPSLPYSFFNSPHSIFHVFILRKLLSSFTFCVPHLLLSRLSYGLSFLFIFGPSFFFPHKQLLLSFSLSSFLLSKNRLSWTGDLRKIMLECTSTLCRLNCLFLSRVDPLI